MNDFSREKPPPLPYRGGREAKTPGRLALVGITLASGVVFALLLYGSIRLGWAFSDRGDANAPGILVFLLPLTVLVGWPTAAILLMTLFHRTAVGAAMLVGFGLALLVGVGTCFALVFTA